MLIGTIVKSNSHISYMCRIYGKLEADTLPAPSDYAFGQFVTLAPLDEANSCLVGIVRDTLLLNPDYGNLGPRLSSDRELAVFSPDYLNERGVLVEVLVLGWLESEQNRHVVPPLAAQIGTRVETMPDALVRDFHRDSHGRFFIGYLPQMMMGNDPMIGALLLTVLERLEPWFPQQARVIGVLKNNLAWKARVVPAG